MAIKIYGMERSTYKQQPFISLNPFGQIPAMENGEITLFESRAINLLLLRPNNLNGQAVLESWMEAEAEAHQFTPPMSIIIRETVINPFFGLIPDERMVEAEAEKLGKVLDVYEERLTRSEYLRGDVYTMADLNHIPYVAYLMKSLKVSLVISRPRDGGGRSWPGRGRSRSSKG